MRTRSQSLKMGSVENVPSKQKQHKADDGGVNSQAKRALKVEKSSIRTFKIVLDRNYVKNYMESFANGTLTDRKPLQSDTKKSNEYIN